MIVFETLDVLVRKNPLFSRERVSSLGKSGLTREKGVLLRKFYSFHNTVSY